MAGYKQTPIYEFKDRLSTGIYDVPIGALVYVRDNNGQSLLVEKASNINLGSGSLVGFFLDDTTAWTHVVHDKVSELEKIKHPINATTGWRLLGVDSNYYGDIGVDAMDLSLSNVTGTYGATGTESFATGKQSTASGISSASFNYHSTASGDYSVAFGYYNIASGNYSMVSGSNAIASKDYAQAFGENTQSNGIHSRTYGRNTIADGDFSTSVGESSHAMGIHSEARGTFTFTANGALSNIISVVLNGSNTDITITAGESAYFNTLHKVTIYDTLNVPTVRNIISIIGDVITVEGDVTTLIDSTKGIHSNSFGTAFSIGEKTRAMGPNAHAEGYQCVAFGQPGAIGAPGASHAEGINTYAQGNASHAEGVLTTASGYASHSTGKNTLSGGNHSSAHGEGTIALRNNSCALGEFNVGTSTTNIVEIGNGIDSLTRSNVLEVREDGLLIAPSASSVLIDVELKALIIKEYLFSAEFGNALPTVPGVTGTLYNNAGVVTVSP